VAKSDKIGAGPMNFRIPSDQMTDVNMSNSKQHNLKISDIYVERERKMAKYNIRKIPFINSNTFLSSFHWSIFNFNHTNSYFECDSRASTLVTGDFGRFFFYFSGNYLIIFFFPVTTIHTTNTFNNRLNNVLSYELLDVKLT
jgi:hypothetical protein